MVSDEHVEKWAVAIWQWKEDCLKQYNAKFGENRRIMESPHDNPSQVVEFLDNGTAHPADGQPIPNAVTPWKDSPHYMD